MSSGVPLHRTFGGRRSGAITALRPGASGGGAVRTSVRAGGHRPPGAAADPRCHAHDSARAGRVPRPAGGVAHAHGLMVLTLRGGRISAITRFLDTGLYAAFELPRTLATGRALSHRRWRSRPGWRSARNEWR